MPSEQLIIQALVFAGILANGIFTARQNKAKVAELEKQIKTLHDAIHVHEQKEQALEDESKFYRKQLADANVPIKIFKSKRERDNG